MNQRERILLIAVIGLGLVFFGSMVNDWVTSGFQKKNNQIVSLRQEVKFKEDIIQAGFEASDRYSAATMRSLPPGETKAKLVYKSWLDDLVKQSEIESPQITFNNLVESNDIYDKLQFSVEGNAHLRDVVRLLHGFYDKDYLHRLRSCQITPLAKRQNFKKVVLTIEVLALKSASDDLVSPDWNSARVSKSLEEYSNAILDRNIWAPANKPPVISTAARQTVEIGGTFSMEIKSSDPEGDENLSYSLVGEPLDGMKLDEKSGRLRWKPDEVGSFKFIVAVTDDGLPAATSQREFSLAVNEKPKVEKREVVEVEVERFDIAKRTTLSSLVSGRERPEAWFYIKPETKINKLTVGDDFEIGKVKGKVIGIFTNYAEIESEDRKWWIQMGEIVSEAYQRGSTE